MAINTNAFERFRRTSATYNKCLVKHTSYFIANHESATTIHMERTDEDLPAVLVVSDNDGADKFITFVYKEEDVKTGDYFTWQEDNHFFIYEKYHVVKEVDYNKFKALECNVLVNNEVWASFKGNQLSFKDTTLQNAVAMSGLKPVLVAPIQDIFVLNGYISFNDKTWHIVDADVDTLHGIGYYYLERSLNARNLEQDIDDLDTAGELLSSDSIYVGQRIELNTERSFIKSNLNIKILERSNSAVSFQPIESGNLEITVLSGGVERTYKYTVEE